MEIKAVIFDMDGTISDSENIAKDVLTSLMQKQGYPFYFEQFINVIGINKNQSIKYLSTFTHDDMISDQILTSSGKIMNEYLKQGKIPLKKGAMDLTPLLLVIIPHLQLLQHQLQQLIRQ